MNDYSFQHYGCYNGITWVCHGISMVSHADHMVISWVSHVYHMGITWVSHGYRKSITWASQWYHMQITWLSLEYLMGITWVYRKSITWASQWYHMQITQCCQKFWAPRIGKRLANPQILLWKCPIFVSVKKVQILWDFSMKCFQKPVLGAKIKEHNLNELTSGTSFSDRFKWSFIAKQAIETF